MLSRPQFTCTLAALACALLLLAAAPRGATVRFYGDAPLPREPETRDASKVEPWEIDLFWDLAENLFGDPGDKTPNVKARNVNTIDELPDSNWFTNRILARQLSIEEVVRGPLTGSGPAPGTWSVIRPKEAGFAPGFHDARRQGRDLVRLVRRDRVPLDALVTENGKHVVRHYLQDVGSTFGTGANAPREYDEGWEYLATGWTLVGVERAPQ
jgi:hypothetical protein